MKNLTNYIVEASEVELDNLLTESMELINNEVTLEHFYLGLFADEVNESAEDSIYEGKIGDFFRKLGNGADKAEDKAREVSGKVKQGVKNAKDAVVAKFEEWSDEAKAAFKKLEEQAGKKWDALKDDVTMVIGKIEGALGKAKKAIGNAISAIGKAMGDTALTLAGFMVILVKYIINTAKKGVKNASEKLTNLFNDTKAMVVKSFEIFGIVLAKNNGFSQDDVNYDVALLYAGK